MKKSLKFYCLCVYLVCTLSISFSQHAVPLAAGNNIIELVVVNASAIEAANIIVTVTSAPEWLKFTALKSEIQNLKSNETAIARFTFSVEKSAPINKPEEVTFTITHSTGERRTKTLLLQVSPPEKFELFQNYPNPFNPTTAISYSLSPNPSPLGRGVWVRVTLKIYDMLGREVETLVNEEKEAGNYSVKFDAGNLPSGIYFYKLQAGNFSEVKKMMLLK